VLRVAESWGTILGTSLLATGLAARLELATITTMFACGATIAWFSRHRRDIRAMIVPTERSVLLPVLVLAGARIEPPSIGRVALIIPVAVVLRFLAKILIGMLIRRHAAARGAGPLLGLALSASGGMSVAIGLAMAIHFPGAVGDTVLATAVAVTVAGEVSGPALRTVLMRAGEARARSPEPPPVSSGPIETEQAGGSS
jgi:Kef-type K+ transport system membrane component KefB